MKRCPECRRDYYDDTLLYCLEDGVALVQGSVPGPTTDADEPPTAVFSDRAALLSEIRRPAPDAEKQTAIIQPPDTYERRNPSQLKFWTIVGTALLLLAGAIGFSAYKFWPKTDKPSLAMSIERLTTNGKSRDAAISPDGKYVVHVLDEGGQQSLWTRQVATTSNVQIVPPADVQYSGLVFTPDSNYINFIRREGPEMPLALFQMPVLGGIQKRLISGISSGVTYAPDGKQFAFVRQSFPTADESSLLIASSDGTGERIVTTLKRPESFATIGGQIPAWSPDGKSIASTAFNLEVTGLRVSEVQVADGTSKAITTREWHSIRRIAWLRDKSGLVILGAEEPSSRYNQQIWNISYPEGEVSRITTDSQHYVGMSVSADSGALAAVQYNLLSNIWVAPNGTAANAVQIRSGGNNRDGFGSLAWTQDGRIVFTSLASGTQDLWMVNGDGTGQKQLTAEAGTNFEAAVAPDGRFIVFTSGREDGNNIWRMDIDGTNLRQLTRGNTDDDADVSADSRWVIYDSRISGGWSVWKISIDGGDAVQLTDFTSREVRVSPDGKLIACEYRESVSSPWRYAIFPFEGGKPVRILDLPIKDQFRWSKDSRSIIYLETQGGVSNLWSFPLEGGPPKQLTHFKSEQMYNFDWSADGKQLVVARGTTTSDVVLIRNFR